MGACMIACGKEHMEHSQREQIYVSTQEMARIEQEVHAQPQKATLHPAQSEENNLCEDKSEQTRESLRNQMRKTTKSRFFQKKGDHESVFSQKENTDNNQQPSPKLELKLSHRKTFKRGKKQHHFRQEDWQDEGSTQRRTSCQLVSKNGKDVSLPPFVTVHEKKPLLLPFKAGQETQPLVQQKLFFKMAQQGQSAPRPNIRRVKYLDGSIYIGELDKGQRHGMGAFKWQDGSHYEGSWKQGNIDGEGKLQYAEGDKYQGEFVCNRAQGKGCFLGADGLCYQGEWKGSLPQGHGQEEFRNGERYSGCWSAGKKNGYGQLFFQDGASFYKGQFANNQLHGQGEYYWHGKSRYIGLWSHNERSGNGCMEWENGQRFQGEFQHDKMHGPGVFFARNGSSFQGSWQFGRRQGVMIETTPSGEVRHGLWYFNKLLNYVSPDQQSLPQKPSHRGRISCPFQHPYGFYEGKIAASQ